jgi:Ssp1 endopeptidase immunity protein Rap1a
MKLTIVLLASALLLVSLPGSAKSEGPFITGKELLRDCESKTRSLCLGFVGGVNDASFVLNMIPYCTPHSATLPQLQPVVTKWLHAHPEQLHRDAAFLVMTALEEAYPCEKKK